MIRTTGLLLAAVAAVAVSSSAASAQQASNEDPLREALRRTTIELRSLQDAQASGQAELEEAKRQRDLLQQQLDRQTSRMGDLEAQAAAAAVLPERDAQLRQLRQDFATAQASNEAMLKALKQWQDAYQEVVTVAKAKDAERVRAEAGLAETQKTLVVCQEKNDKLVEVAEETLGLYRTQDFVSLLRGSWEPLLGLQQVKLDTVVQDYQDKILDQRFEPPASSPVPGAAPAASAAGVAAASPQ